MGIIAWIILGLVAGLLARMLVPGKDSQGLIITLVLGIAGALLGGFVATQVFHVSGIQGFFNLSTWICAIVGAAVLLLAYNLITGRRTGRRTGRWAGRR
ncbi:GlsB/YeaQ/YmgE family stress response membrane protein [Nonomuraea fuscirosea]|uniref:GlsB/YeaQ/YmgE family stress response membrane protein n=1 Tax=Nonomuraea fuscirosea TaxID=1291556 RepID=UPI0034401F7E